MILRDYQDKMIREIKDLIRQGHRRILAQLPTGGGKTVIAAFITLGAQTKQKRVWFVCHRDFLIEQTYGTFDEVGLEPSVVAAGKGARYRPTGLVQVCGVATVVNRLDTMLPPDIIVWDEAHHAAAGTWAKIADWAKSALQIGLSATPERLDGKGLDGQFDVMVQGPSVEHLMSIGALARYKAYAPSTPDLTGVKTSHGDYNQSQLADAVDKPELVGDIVEHYRKLAAGKRAVYFAVNVEHSRHIADAFTAAGIPALHLDASSSSAERAAAARSFALGELQILTNVNLFGEGYDLSAQARMPVTIDAVGMARSTQSLAMYMQQVGRALRPKSDGSHAIILDHAGNIVKHGLPDDEREWKLEGRKKNAATHKGVHICGLCFAANEHGARFCFSCGTPLQERGEQRSQREIDHADGELVEIDRERLAQIRAQEERSCETLADWEALAETRGYKRSWAKIRYEIRAKKMTVAA